MILSLCVCQPEVKYARALALHLLLAEIEGDNNIQEAENDTQMAIVRMTRHTVTTEVV